MIRKVSSIPNFKSDGEILMMNIVVPDPIYSPRFRLIAVIRVRIVGAYLFCWYRWVCGGRCHF